MLNATNVERGTEYELFVQAVYQALVNADGVENVEVRHNIEIKGNSGCNHQIDVYWEFLLAGHLYRTAIECKAFNQTVTVGRIRDFYGVLVDVPGLIGVFATLMGYQSGAKLFADHYGISLKELRKPTEKDWKGRVKDIHLSFHMVSPTITKFAPRVSAEFLASIPEGEELRFSGGFMTDEPIIFDRSGSPVSTYEGLRQGLPADGGAGMGFNHFVSFPDHVLEIGGRRIDIEGVDLTYDVAVDEEKIVLRGEELAQAIIKDVASGELTFVGKDNRVHHPRA
jgi:hypothetical protein